MNRVHMVLDETHSLVQKLLFLAQHLSFRLLFFAVHETQTLRLRHQRSAWIVAAQNKVVNRKPKLGHQYDPYSSTFPNALQQLMTNRLVSGMLVAKFKGTSCVGK